MTDAKLDTAKKEVRSLLITFQKGCSLSEFQKEYRKVIGRYLPSKEFNFRDDISFLRSMPDTVSIRPSRVPGDYHLFGIADESVEHIQKMICKQKPAKHPTFKIPRRRPILYNTNSYRVPYKSREPARPRERYNVPPRFCKKELPPGVDKHVLSMLNSYSSGLQLSAFLDTFCRFYKRHFTFRDWGFVTLDECLMEIPTVRIDAIKNNEKIVYVEKRASEKKSAPSIEELPMGVEEQIINLLVSYPGGLNLSDFLVVYCHVYKREFTFRDWGFTTLEECIETIPKIQLETTNNEIMVYLENSASQERLQMVAEIPVEVEKGVVYILGSCSDGLELNRFLETFFRVHRKQFTFRDWGFSTLEECLETIPGIQAETRNNKVVIYLENHASREENVQRIAKIPAGFDKYVVRMLVSYPNGLEMSQFLDTFHNFYKKQFTFKDWGFSTLEECLETIPELQAETRNNKIIIYLENNASSQEENIQNTKTDSYENSTTQMSIETSSNQNLHSKTTASKDNFLLNRFVEDVNREHFRDKLESSPDVHFLGNSQFNTVASTPFCDTKNPKTDDLDDFQLIDYREPQSTIANSNTASLLDFENSASKNLDTLDSFVCSSSDFTPSISANIKYNLQKVMEKYPQGIFASEFPNCYQKVTKTSFDLHSLGFHSFSDFVDAVPDILVRRPLGGSKKDWVIYPTSSSENMNSAGADAGKNSVLFIECIILNTRKILQAFSEGVKLNDFIHMYSINCNEPLYIRDLGFDNIENFLLSIAQRVPLRITTHGDHKYVLMEQFQEEIKPPVAVEVPAPTDIALPDAKYMQLVFPPNYDHSKYIPIYTSSIANPDLLYIQLEGKEHSEALKILYDEIEAHYCGKCSDLYIMKTKDIKVGTVCAALWPDDNHWYRAKILSIISMDFVQVYYVDYGTTDDIPLNMLRYMKREYMELPAQAMKAKLAYMKPPNQSSSWDKRCRSRMLALCNNRSLMAQITSIKNDVLSLIICNTNGDTDLFINDILTTEGLAEISRDFDEVQQPPQTDIVFQQQIVQFLSAIATSPESVAQMFQNFTMNKTPGTEPPGFAPQQLPSIPSPVPPLFPPYIQQPINNIYPNLMYNTITPNLMNPIQTPLQPSYGVQMMNNDIKPLASDAVIGIIKEPTPRDNASGSSSPVSDVFDDDDDELFEQFCKKVSSGKTNVEKCYVKRIKTGDGYIFHILLVDSKPFVSSGDISVLIWSAKEPVHLFHRLQIEEVELPSTTLHEEGNEEFFEQLNRFSVKGIQKFAGNKSSVLMYPLESVNQILNMFGHPSAAVRAKIATESNAFNPLAPNWQQLEGEVPEEIEEIRSVTDDDKLNRLCLYDLKTMKEGIRMKRLKLSKSAGNSTGFTDEITKLDQLFCKVRDRIQEIEQICSMFSIKKK